MNKEQIIDEAYENYLDITDKKWMNSGVGDLDDMIYDRLLFIDGDEIRILKQEEFNYATEIDPEFSKKWYTKDWWKQLEREDLTEEEFKELDNLSIYDQLLSTVGRGVQCDDCALKEAELYEKYYRKNIILHFYRCISVIHCHQEQCTGTPGQP